MNLRQVARLLAAFTLFFTLTLVAPLVVSSLETTADPTTEAFVGAMAIGLALAIGLRLFGSQTGSFFRKEGLAVVGLAWFLAGTIAAVPFVWSGAIPDLSDAWFESISGLTTTGATVLGTDNRAIESLPPSILLWRSMLQWMGGVGIILVFIALLPSMGITGSRLLSSEQVGMNDEGARPRMADQARRLFRLYVGLTVLAALCYWVVGMTVFDAICHAFTTVATGGFSTQDASVGGFHNIGVELVAIVFMFLAGCNFLLMLRVLSRRRTGSAAVHYTEFRVFAGIIVVVSLTIAVTLWLGGESQADELLGVTHDYRDFSRCLRDGLFQTVSICTSTGYANSDYQAWPKAAVYMILLCMLVGGCTGSTSGGFKVMRLIICTRLAAFTLRTFVRPRSVETVKVAREVIPDRVALTVLGLLLLWIATVAAGSFVLCLDPRLDLASAFTASISMVGCIGPSFGEVLPLDPTHTGVSAIDLGPYAGYGELHPATKVFMSAQMVLGRLEILAPLALLTPRFWRT